jgi:fatty acid kinase fatty acid binding subunit
MPFSKSPDTIAILADSTCDIPKDMLERYNIQIVPQIVVWDGHEYRDRVDLTPEDFYRRLKADRQHPTSAMPTRQSLQEAFESVCRQGAQAAVFLTISSAMSGTYQLASSLAQAAPLPVHVVDARGPTMSLGWQVLAAARARDDGASLSQILAEIERVRRGLVLLVSMETMEYLQRGGRIGGAAKWIGMKLQIRPLVAINHTTGLVEPVGLTRTHNKAVDFLYQEFFSRLGDMQPLVGPYMHLAVLHGANPEDALHLEQRIRQEYDPLELLVNITGPVLGMNTGPGALALCGYLD